MKPRISTGIQRLDEALGGGLLPGSLTMVVGATGVGKTQLGTHFSQAGQQQERHTAAIIDLSSRGDSQNHLGYAQRMFNQTLQIADPHRGDLEDAFSGKPEDVLPFLGYRGRRVLRSQMDGDEWHAWQSELNRRMPLLFRFVYRHLVHGTRRFVIDGIEPQQAASDSLQLDLLELIYHRMLRQEHDWLAREVLRQDFLKHQSDVARRAYDHRESLAMVLVTTKQTMLEELITEALSDGDLMAGANTVIILGRQMQAGRLSRGLYVAKHRGSFADESILPFDINDAGIQLG